MSGKHPAQSAMMQSSRAAVPTVIYAPIRTWIQIARPIELALGLPLWDAFRPTRESTSGASRTVVRGNDVAMCFSAEVSYAAAVVLFPSGAVAVARAYRCGRRYLPLAALPALFALQQLFEGLVWTASHGGDAYVLQYFALAYMFFSWLAWPVWIPYATYFLEPCARRRLYLVFAILGAMLGALQYVPYFAHEGWLIVKFLRHAISYEGTVLFDLIMRREVTYGIYLFVILVPLLSSSKRTVNVFGALIALVAAVTYVFFSYAHISVFCFGGAIMSGYIVWMVFHETPGKPTRAKSASVHGSPA